MGKIENYLFNVDADTEKAVKKLGKLQQMMDNIEKLNNNAVDNYHTTDQKSMDKNMRSMREATQLYKQLSRELDELQTKMREVSDTAVIPENATTEQAEAIRRLKTDAEKQSRAAIGQQRALRREYNETLRTFTNMAKYQQNYSKNFQHVFSSKDIRNLPSGGATKEDRADSNQRARNIVGTMANDKDDVSSRLGDVMSKIQSVTKLDRRTESASRRAAASNYMSFQQAKNFEKDVSTVRGSYRQDADDNLAAITNIGQRRGELSKGIKQIEENPEATNADMDKKIAMQREIEAMDKEWDARMELNRALERSIQSVEKYNQAVQGVEMKPERGTFKGMIYERAPAIGLALGGATGLAVGGLHQRGDAVKKQINDDVISIGQRTDSTEWRDSIRDPALDSGLEDRLGFSGQQMLDFQNNYLSNAGYNGMDDLQSAAQSQAEFSRVSGLNAQDTQQFYDSVYSTGAVDGLQSKDIQDAFVGAIKNSGMEGREKDQITALEGLLETVKQGKTLDNSDVMNVMGLQSILASSGERSLRGEQGGQLLQGIDEGIKSGFDNPMVRMVFGQGTEYQGLEGRFALRKQLDKGISDPDNIARLAEFSEMQAPGNEIIQNEAFAEFARGTLGVDMSGEQAEGMMDLYRKGELSAENAQRVLAGDKAVGAEVSEERFKEYQDSNEATENQSSATWEKQAVQLNDFTDIIREANSRMGNWNTAAYAATVAAGALAVAMFSTAGMFGVSTLVRRGAAGTVGGGGGLLGRLGRGRGGGGSGGGGGVGGWFGGGRNGGGGGGRSGANNDSRYNNYRQNGAFGNRGAGPVPPTPPPGANAGFFGKIKDMFRGGAGANGGGGMLGKAGNILGKAALPVAALLGVGAIASAPEGEKAETTGSVVGGIGGGLLGGAATGALVGSIAGPIGTAIGGIIGGIGGSIAGSGLGGWIGSKFGGGKAEDASKAEEAMAASAGLGVAGAAATSGISPVGTAGTTPAGTLGMSTGTASGSILGLAGTTAATAGTLGLSQKSTEEKAKDVFVQMDRENTNRRDQAEDKKSDNLADERDNLTRYESILDKAQQLLHQARSQNGIFGSANGMGAAGGESQISSVMSGSETAEKVWSFFENNGFNEKGIAGIMGNLQQESGLDPTAVNSSNGAFGIAQWMGGRKTNLDNFAKEKGTANTDLGTQLEFLLKELQGGEATTKQILDRNGGINALKGATDVKAATDLFEKAFERSGGDAMGKRRDYADGYYNQYGKTGGSAQWGSTGTDASVSRASSGVLKIDSKFDITLRGDETVSDKVRDDKNVKDAASKIQNMIYGNSMDFFSKEMRMV